MLSSTLRQAVTYSAPEGRANGIRTVKAIRGMLFVILLLAATPRPGAAQEDIKIGVNPNVLRPVNGKLPQSLNIAVYSETCPTGTNFKTGFTLWATGGLTVGKPSFGTCSATSTLAIDPSLPAGTYKIFLLKDNQPVGHADLTVMDASAGALPPGLGPQVDVLWQVMTQGVASDVFGKRVAKSFYCIEVKIGNNTGYALQLAGIGFSHTVFNTPVKQGNASYAATRAVLQRETSLSRRNMTYYALQVAGLLMAGFTPFFVNPTSKAHYATASSIVSGARLQAFNIVAPDRVPGQLVNLDDQSLRDGSVIANNSQVRTTIFVKKRELTEALAQAAAEEEKDEGALLSGLDKESNKIHAQNASTIRNSTHHFLGSTESPFLIRKALGVLVIVGDPIEYLPRVQIQSSSSGQSSSVSLSATSLSFTKAKATQTVTLTNTGTGALAINSITTDAAAFSTSNTCGSSVEAGANCDITVTFTPQAAMGPQSAELKIDDSASGSPQMVNLSGTESSVQLGPNPLIFPDQPVGKASSSVKVTVTNAGTASFTIPGNPIGGTDKGLFSLDTTRTQADACGSTLPAGQTCGLYVIFTPTKAGSFNATLSIADDVHASAPTINLTGTGK